jgi:hypothetical protein
VPPAMLSPLAPASPPAAELAEDLADAPSASPPSATAKEAAVKQRRENWYRAAWPGTWMYHEECVRLNSGKDPKMNIWCAAESSVSPYRREHHGRLSCSLVR